MRLTMRPLAAAAALSVLTACGSITDPTGPTDPGSPLFGRKPPRQARTPILFVHGWNSSEGIWSTMIGRFRKDGWRSSELASFSYNTAASNVTTAGIIGQQVQSLLDATGATQVAIVTHSMGSLSARYYVRNLGGDGKVSALVSLAGPNHGTQTANFCFQTSCREMQPGSSFLTALNSTDETWGSPLYGTWWTSCDQVIIPQTSTILDGADNTQTSCMQHSDLYSNAAVYDDVRDFVSQPAPAAFIASAR